MTSIKIDQQQLPLPPLPTKEKQTPWKSILVCGIIGVCQAIQFSLYLASLWPYLHLVSFFGKFLKKAENLAIIYDLDFQKKYV
jgi:hypothetical protein